jgi:RHS repeat-associated protein
MTFGSHIGTTGNVENPYRYAGYRWDAETGLYYLNARYYAPEIGRFITRDAFHGFEDDPASLNWYNYAHSNPVTYVDLNGYFATRLTHLYTGLRMLWDGLKGLFLVGILLANPQKIKIVYTVRALATAAIGALGLQRYATVILTVGAILIVGAELAYNWKNLRTGIWHLRQAVSWR